MAKPHKEIPSGMFVVSKGIKEKNQLNGWIKHFHEKGISTKIIKRLRNQSCDIDAVGRRKKEFFIQFFVR